MVIDVAAAAESIRLDDNWSADIYRQWDFPPEVIDWWQAASDRQGDIGLFTSPGWLEQCWLAWGTPLFVVVLRERDRIRGLVPCQEARTDFGDPGICSLSMDASHYGFLAQGDMEPVMAAFVRLIESHFPAHHLQFECLCESSARYVQQRFGARQFPMWTHSQPFAPWISAEGGWNEFLSSLSSNFRWDLKRKRRRAELDGRVECELHRDAHGLQDLLGQGFELEAGGWKGRASSAICHKPLLERFLRLASEWAARENKLYLFVLRHNGNMVAFQLNLVHGGTMFLYETSFDERAARYSPGQLLTLQVLEHALGDPTIQKFNFLGRHDGWKLRWTKQGEICHWLTIYPRTVAGRCQYLWRHGWKEQLKRSRAVRGIVEKARRARGAA
jgi:hypothetical protein